MIFKPEHIEMIRKGTKTQTRRLYSGYHIGHSYAVQEGRGACGLPDMRIVIKRKWVEEHGENAISREDADAEGGYTPEEYERLYSSMYPEWFKRTAYEFEAATIKLRVQETLSLGEVD